jgi:uncharacterized cofD-like protein
MIKPYRVVVMGGGTGTFPVITGLKNLPIQVDSIIAVSDSGGSTGKIRDEFGFQPVGDLRQSLAALAENQGGDWIRKILLYRFNKGQGLSGHNLGNLILTALQDMTGDTTEAMEIARRVFRIHGHVIPVTRETVDLEIHYQDGSTVIGEHTLDEKITQPKKIDHIALVPPAVINPTAAEAIKKADLVIIGPGDYYASLLAVLTVGGIKKSFSNSSCQVMYILNLMTRFTQTHEMTAQDHVVGIEAAIGKSLTHILVNTSDIPESALTTYAAEKEFPVIDDLGKDKRVIRKPIMSFSTHTQSAHDAVQRSLLRHDPVKLETVFKNLIKKHS